jgi:hypothetical protein
MKWFVIKGLIFLWFFFLLSPVLASKINVPHIYISSYGGTLDGNSSTLGQADILAPLYLLGDRNLFIYGQARGSNKDAINGTDDPWQVAAGFGCRQIAKFNKIQQVFGAYILVDSNHSRFGNTFWDISPGVETLGDTIDARINAYIPIKKNDAYDSYFDHFAGHQSFNQITKEEEAIGGDAEVGVHLFSIHHMPVKAYLDGYYFSTDEQDITGVGGRITFQPTRYLTLELRDTYDNSRQNTFMGEIQIYLNGMSHGMRNTHVDDQSIQQRLYDPIERNLGTIGVANSVMISSSSNMVSTQDHINFIKADNTTNYTITGDGTFENPYIYTEGRDMQVILDNAYQEFPDYSLAYFASGSYTIDGQAHLWAGQQIWGRATGWVSPAITDQVVFYGAMTTGVKGVGGNYAMHNFTLLDNSDNNQEQGIYENAGSLLIDGLNIGSTDSSKGYKSHAIRMQSNPILTIKNSNLVGNSNALSGGSAVFLWDGGVITAIQNSNLSGEFGVYSNKSVNPSLNPTIIGDVINSNFEGTYGIYIGADFVSMRNISDSNFNVALYSLLLVSGNDITVGNIRNSNLTGEYSVYLVSDRKLTVGDITDSNINSSGNKDAYFKSNDDMIVGNIINSNFSAADYGTFFASYKNMFLGNINNSNFNSTGYSVFFHASEIMIIGDIRNSNFVSDYEGSYFASYGDLIIGEISDSILTMA